MRSSIRFLLVAVIALGIARFATADNDKQYAPGANKAAAVGYTPAPTPSSQAGSAPTPSTIQTVIVPGEPDFAKTAQRAHGKPGTVKH